MFPLYPRFLLTQHARSQLHASFQTFAFVYLISSASLIGNDISIFSVVDYRKKLITKNCNDSRQGNLRFLHVFVYENWSDKKTAWQIFVLSWDAWNSSQLTSGVFEVDFSLYCHYAGETILEDFYRVMASDPFITGQVLLYLH